MSGLGMARVVCIGQTWGCRARGSLATARILQVWRKDRLVLAEIDYGRGEDDGGREVVRIRFDVLRKGWRLDDGTV